MRQGGGTRHHKTALYGPNDSPRRVTATMPETLRAQIGVGGPSHRAITSGAIRPCNCRPTDSVFALNPSQITNCVRQAAEVAEQGGHFSGEIPPCGQVPEPAGGRSWSPLPPGSVEVVKPYQPRQGPLRTRIRRSATARTIAVLKESPPPPRPRRPARFVALGHQECCTGAAVGTKEFRPYRMTEFMNVPSDTPVRRWCMDMAC